jgi:hypothetical protein
MISVEHRIVKRCGRKIQVSRDPHDLGLLSTSIARAATPDQPRLDGAGILQDFGFEFLELGVQDDPLDGGSEGLVAGFPTFLLDEGQNCLGELQSVYRVAHSPDLLPI